MDSQPALKRTGQKRDEESRKSKHHFTVYISIVSVKQMWKPLGILHLD